MSGDEAPRYELVSIDGLLGGVLALSWIADRAGGGTVMVKSLRPYIRVPKLEGGVAKERDW